ncbi:hypothetical protein [Desulfomarina profundi]|uniref:hypothetical protein n=1 Tax=Desulfomarina profundi TaxID=2772557 RepID=UPI001E34D14C|nr:hypothetical protein [Desulfomarina profundi]
MPVYLEIQLLEIILPQSDFHYFVAPKGHKYPKGINGRAIWASRDGLSEKNLTQKGDAEFLTEKSL